jgi:hypothetical protein
MLALLVVGAAWAQDDAWDTWPPPPPPPPVLHSVPLTVDPIAERWQRRDRRARGTYAAGLVVGLTGFTFDAVGFYTGSEDLRAFGVMNEVIGAPLMAGGSLRSARAIREQGVYVGRGWGAMSWTMWNSAWMFDGAASNAEDEALDAKATMSDDHDKTAAREAYHRSQVLGSVALGCRVGAYLAAMLQAGDNHRGRRTLGVASTGDPPMGGFVLAPTYDGSAVGLVVSSTTF